jgi:hypothetical protein
MDPGQKAIADGLWGQKVKVGVSTSITKFQRESPRALAVGVVKSIDFVMTLNLIGVIE